MSQMNIVFGNSNLARYLQGGGMWLIGLQYLLGLKELGHNVFLLELLWSTGDADLDNKHIKSFFNRLDSYGLKDQCALLLFDKDSEEQNLECATSFGKSLLQVKETISNADLLLNDCGGIRQPLLGKFRHRAFIDLDPGHLQVSALTVDMDLFDHHVFLSVGKKLHQADCNVPTLGLDWHTFHPFVYLPMWNELTDPGCNAPFSSITHWEWGELRYKDLVLSISKRDAYLRYLELPKRSKRPFQLAASINPEDDGGDLGLLKQNGWNPIDPWKVSQSPTDYQNFIASSRAEIMCPKPIFREMNTGWFSDRSACYLASGRPVLAEDTGFSDFFPTGKGLLRFRNLAEAIEGVSEIDKNYKDHMRSAREFAVEFLDSKRCLKAMLSACV